MGYSVTPACNVPHSTRIRAHSASLAQHCGRTQAIRTFARGRRVTVETVEETGDLIVTRDDGAFIQGPRAPY